MLPGDTARQGAGAQESAGEAVKKNKPRLPKAIPEDVQQIVSRWPTIVGNTDNPMRTYLKSARLTLGGDSRLVLALEDGMASDYFIRHPENKAQLEALLSDFSGKEMEVGIETVSGGQEFEENFVDISQVILTDIEEEDEE